ncbi:MAG: error-prone DNA polymerase [Actinomycetota bacterium]|nr:error-prone DNA polymerase [Actinomycetota bacterium]
MGTFNPVVPWSEIERRLSGRAAPPAAPPATAGPGGARAPGTRSPSPRGGPAYAELHCHSSFSFLDGASPPEELVGEAERLGLEALALTDHDGCYGVVRFAAAARDVGLPTVFGAELGLPVTPAAGTAVGRERAGARSGAIDPEASHLVVVARDPDGYARLSTAIARAQLAGGEKGRPAYDLGELAGAHAGTWWVLTGCRHGAVPAALEQRGPAAAAREIARLVDAFGRDSVAVELFDHGSPVDGARNDALAELAARAGVAIVATANAHYATSSRYPLSTALAAIRARSSLSEVEGYLPAWGAATLRSGAEQARRFRRYPGAVEQAAEIGRACAFDLGLVAPGLPPYPVPAGEDEPGFLRCVVEEGGTRRYGPRGAERVPGAWAQLDRELAVVGQLGFAGYFLVVWDIVEFCRRSGIFCQGRGSAANSAVCYALGVTNADAVGLGLLFERFLSPAREGPPDIDLDIESSRRDEVIAYVYERYGREHAAQVANVVTYRPRSAVRDVGRALGYPPGALDAWSRQIGSFFGAPLPAGHDIPAEVLRLAGEIDGFPRHLGVHSGGMVICDRPVVAVCPVEWARREGRTVLQWDKDDCAAVGLVKFDLLGLGMLEALHRMVDFAASSHDVAVDLATIPQDPAVYEMLARADSMGVFQVESRAQMATLPRLRPSCFYDLVVEVALIRPGPIQGGSVHPYLRRRSGEEEVSYLHPLLEPALAKTLGVPLFQEQLMQMAIDVAGLSAVEADRLRQAMGAKRSTDQMERLRERLYAGMADRGVRREVADAIYAQLAAFANYGFPESHAVSFAYLVYASAWFKLRYPAVFLAGLLDSQPMGFWSPQSLVADARRHGVVVLGPDVNESAAGARLVPAPTPDAGPVPVAAGQPSGGGPAVRLGLGTVRGVGAELAERVASGAPYTSLEDLARRSGATRPQLEALAIAGACGRLPLLDGDAAPPAGRGRREVLWAVGALAGDPGRLPGVVVGVEAPPLPDMGPAELAATDLWATGVTGGDHPFAHLRPALEAGGVFTAAGLVKGAGEGRVTVAGIVTHRQRPSTAGGTVFVNLEDETGVVNVICSPGCWARYRAVLSGSPALAVRGRVERVAGVVSVVAERVDPVDLALAPARARDFR